MDIRGNQVSLTLHEAAFAEDVLWTVPPDPLMREAVQTIHEHLAAWIERVVSVEDLDGLPSVLPSRYWYMAARDLALSSEAELTQPLSVQLEMTAPQLWRLRWLSQEAVEFAEQDAVTINKRYEVSRESVAELFDMPKSEIGPGPESEEAHKAQEFEAHLRKIAIGTAIVAVINQNLGEQTL